MTQTVEGHRRYLTLRNCRPDDHSSRGLLPGLAAAARRVARRAPWAAKRLEGA